MRGGRGLLSLAFAFAEKLRVNVGMDCLDRTGLAVGPWLKEAKQPGGKRVFLEEDEAIAARKRHLTAAQAGPLGAGRA